MNPGIEKTEAAMKGGMDAVMKSVGATTKSAQTIAIEWADYAKVSYEQAAAAAEKLAKAKNPGQAFEIQTEYLKGAYERTMAQATTFRDLYVAMAKDAAAPFRGMALPKTA
ncbi:phasin family protein [Methylobacterium sp. A54F]|jgi:hypothetical protein